MSPTRQIPAARDPRINPPWSCCGDVTSPDFGYLFAEKALGDATALYFDRARNQHACTVFHAAAEGELIDIAGRDFIVTWGDAVQVGVAA